MYKFFVFYTGFHLLFVLRGLRNNKNEINGNSEYWKIYNFTVNHNLS